MANDLYKCLCEGCGQRFESKVLVCPSCGSENVNAIRIEEGPTWDVPARDEKWTADQLSKYFGLVYNDLFDDPEMRKKGAPPWIFGPEGALLSAIKEQIIHAFKLASQQKPMIVLPGMVKPGPGGRMQ